MFSEAVAGQWFVNAIQPDHKDKKSLFLGQRGWIPGRRCIFHGRCAWWRRRHVVVLDMLLRLLLLRPGFCELPLRGGAREAGGAAGRKSSDFGFFSGTPGPKRPCWRSRTRQTHGKACMPDGVIRYVYRYPRKRPDQDGMHARKRGCDAARLAHD